jgi:serine/threonine protein kinase
MHRRSFRVTGKPPFHSLAPVTALFKIGSSPATPAVPDELSNNLKDFLSHCFQRDPKLRASTAELLKHPFLNEDGDLGTFYALIMFHTTVRNYFRRFRKRTSDSTLCWLRNSQWQRVKFIHKPQCIIIY